MSRDGSEEVAGPDGHPQDEEPQAAGPEDAPDPEPGLPPSVAAMSVPAATLYSDPSVVQPLPEAERWEVAVPRTGSIEDLPTAEPPVDPVDPGGTAGTAGPGEAAVVAAPESGAQSPASPSPVAGRGPWLLVGGVAAVVLVLVGIVVVLAGGGGDGPEVADGGDPSAEVSAGGTEEGKGDEAPGVVDVDDTGEGSTSTTVGSTSSTTEEPATATTVTTSAPVTAESVARTVPAAPATSPPTSAAVVVTVPTTAAPSPARLQVTASPLEGDRLVVVRGGAPGTITIRNIGDVPGVFNLSGEGLVPSPANGSVPPRGSVTVSIAATPGPDRSTRMQLQGSGGILERFEVVVK